jgi:hypothetical protein
MDPFQISDSCPFPVLHSLSTRYIVSGINRVLLTHKSCTTTVLNERAAGVYPLKTCWLRKRPGLTDLAHVKHLNLLVKSTGYSHSFDISASTR